MDTSKLLKLAGVFGIGYLAGKKVNDLDQKTLQKELLKHVESLQENHQQMNARIKKKLINDLVNAYDANATAEERKFLAKALDNREVLSITIILMGGEEINSKKYSLESICSAEKVFEILTGKKVELSNMSISFPTDKGYQNWDENVAASRLAGISLHFSPDEENLLQKMFVVSSSLPQKYRIQLFELFNVDNTSEEIQNYIERIKNILNRGDKDILPEITILLRESMDTNNID